MRERVATGDITVSVRLWQRPKVTVGGRYASHGSTIEVDAVELLPFSAICADDVARSGEIDREALRHRAAHAGPIDEDTLVYRIEFHVVEEPPADTRTGIRSGGCSFRNRYPNEHQPDARHGIDSQKQPRPHPIPERASSRGGVRT